MLLPLLETALNCRYGEVISGEVFSSFSNSNSILPVPYCRFREYCFQILQPKEKVIPSICIVLFFIGFMLEIPVESHAPRINPIHIFVKESLSLSSAKLEVVLSIPRLVVQGTKTWFNGMDTRDKQ